MKKNLLFLLPMLLFFQSSCQRDDICPEGVQTTPKLVIEFFDVNNPESLKNVPRLNVQAEGQDTVYFETTENTNQISIPLRTSESFTNYTFSRQFDPPESSSATQNDDQIQFTYAVNEDYVSRACGVKAEFLQFTVNVIGEPNNQNWIKSIEVQQPNDIVDEQTTHLYIFH